MRALIFGGIGIVVILMMGYYDRYKRNSLLEKSQVAVGIFEGHSKGVGNSGYWITYVNRDGINVEKAVCYNPPKFLKKGDTVLIKYSIEDNLVVKIIDPFYMQKYKNR